MALSPSAGIEDKIDSHLLAKINNTSKIPTNSFSASSTFSSNKIPVIITLVEEQNPVIYSVGLREKGINIPYTFNIINGMVAEVYPNQVFDIASDLRVNKIYLDRQYNITDSVFRSLQDFNLSQSNENFIETLNESTHQIGATDLWNLGYKGEGVSIAILDTGIDNNHPALEGRVLKNKDFTWWDGRLDSSDFQGHGTHVAGIVGGFMQNASPSFENTKTKYSVNRNTIFDGENLIASYSIDVDSGPSPPPGLFYDEHFPIGSSHARIIDSNGASINLITFSNITCNPTIGSCDFPEAVFTAITYNDTFIDVGDVLKKETGTEINFSWFNSLELNRNFEVFDDEPIFSGVAPESELWNVKVLGDYGYGFDSSIIKGIEWATENNVDIVSMSLGGFGHSDDILSKVVDNAIEKGTVVVIAAGNSGYFGEFNIGSPGTSREAITVGATDSNGDVAGFSSVGPLITGEIKPDITAPGVEILSACSGDSYFGCNHDEGDYFIPLSGTSMAAPHVSGAIALLLNANPNLNPIQVKSVIKNGATPLEYYPILEGAGLISLNKSISLLDGIFMSPQSFFFGALKNKSVEDIGIDVTIFNFNNFDDNVSLDINNEPALYFSPSNLLISANGNKTIKLYLNVSMLEDLYEFPDWYGGTVSFNINNEERFLGVSLIVPKELPFTDFDYYSTFSDSAQIGVSDKPYDWYTFKVTNNTFLFNSYLTETNGSFLDSIFAVINPNLGIEYKSYVFPDYWGDSFTSSFSQYFPNPGDWIFFRNTDLINGQSIELELQKPSFRTQTHYDVKQKGDIYQNNYTIFNLLDFPLHASITDFYDTYANGRFILGVNDSVNNGYSMVYIEANINNLTEGFVTEFKREDNQFDCKKFSLYIFEPSGEQWNFYPYTIWLNNDPTYKSSREIYIYETEKEKEGTWTFILVPITDFDQYCQSYSSIDNYEANINLTITDMVVDEFWSTPLLDKVSINPYENRDLIFETKIPEDTVQSFHYDRFELTLSTDDEDSIFQVAYLPIFIDNSEQGDDNEEVDNIIIHSPSKELFDSRKIQLDIEILEEVDEISYIDKEDSRPRERRLCRNCNKYNRTRSFREGFHILEIKGYLNKELIVSEEVSFIIDSKSPKISKTEPRKGFANGEFLLEFIEENSESLVLNYGNSIVGFRTNDNPDECNLERKIVCSTNVDLSDYDSQEITYWFEITDIVGNSAQSRKISLEVDMTEPKILDFDYLVNKRRVEFNFMIEEDNFDSITYIDNADRRPRERRLCSRLRDGACTAKKSFRRGEHELTIFVKDKAGNMVEENISFEIS